MGTVRRGTLALFGLLAAAAACAGGEASAATINVPADQPTVQQGINAASDGDTVAIAAGVYAERLYVIDRADLTIAGAGEDLTVLSATVADPPIFYVRNSTGLRISGMTLKGNGVGSTGIVVTGWRHDTVPRSYEGPSTVALHDVVIRGFTSVGAFVGAIGCAPLAAGSLDLPACYLQDRSLYVDPATSLTLVGCTVEDNGAGGAGTGLVYFPGTTGAVTTSLVDRNKLTGIFVWGSRVDIADSSLDANVEHALEYRQYPSPLLDKGLLIRSAGLIERTAVTDSRPLPGGALGGGMVTQASDLTLVGADFSANHTWGISADNGSTLAATDSTFGGNGLMGVVVKSGSRATFQGGAVTANAQAGIIAQEGSFVGITGGRVADNGHQGVLVQRQSEGHLDGVEVSGNGTAGPPYGGVFFRKGSFGSVSDSVIGGHANGPGIGVSRSFDEVFITGSTLADNAGVSGVLVAGASSLAALAGNTFSGNAPFDVNCRRRGSVYATPPVPLIKAACRTSADTFLEIPAGGGAQVLSTQIVGHTRFSAAVTGSRPFQTSRTLDDAWGIAGGPALPATAASWTLAGGTTAGGAESRITVFNPGRSEVRATVVLDPAGAPSRTVRRRVRPGRRATILASKVIGAGLDFTATVEAPADVAAELRVTGAGFPARPAEPAGRRWYAAEGNTRGGAETLLQLDNPDPDFPTLIRLRYYPD